MKRFSYNSIAALCAGILSLGAMTSCDKEKILTEDYPEAYPTTEITFVVSEELPLGVGMDSTLVYKVGPESATNKTILFSSTNPAIASVDENGKITANSVGEVTISAVPVIGFGASASVIVKVIPEVIKAEELVINNTTAPSEEGYYYETDQIQLTCDILPADHTYNYLTWTSENKEVATVDENGLVTCLKEGDAHIRCHTHDHSNVAADYKFHVYKMQEVERLEIVPVDEPLCISQRTLKLDVTYYPEGATIGSVKWESSDETVASVSRGVVTLKGWGSATISGIATNGSSATVTITVESGWYIWDANFGFGNWEATNSSVQNGVLHVPFSDPNGGKWRNDLKYTGISADNPLPLDWSSYKVVASRMLNLAEGGNANMDAVDALTGTNSNNLRPTRTQLADGSTLYIWDASAKYNNAYTEMRIFNFKVADIPNDRYTPGPNAYYDVKWLRTFKTAEDAMKFAEEEVAAGK